MGFDTSVGLRPAQIACASRPAPRLGRRLEQVVNVYRFRVRTDGEERPHGVKVHAEYPGALGSSPILSQLFRIRYAEHPDDGSLVGSRSQHGPLRIDGHCSNGRLVCLDHVNGRQGDRVKDQD